MSEMVERVARAILAEQEKEPFPNNLNLARAAIAAMREPTEAMKTADGVHWDFNCGTCGGVAEGWAKLIDEALK